jgi:hydrogenase nickel incorporation protein HypA/HybF
MHEMSIAEALVRQILRVAQENRLARIDRVELEVGALQLIVPEALDLAFRMAVRDTVAEGAELVQEEIAVEAECRACGHRYEPDPEIFLCDRCGRAEPKILRGRDIILKSLTGPEIGKDEAPANPEE